MSYTTLLSDDFNRTSGLGSSYINESNAPSQQYYIDAGKLRKDTSGGFILRGASETPTNSQQIEFTFTATQYLGADEVGGFLNLTGSGATAILGRIKNAALELYSRVATNYSLLTSVNIPVSEVGVDYVFRFNTASSNGVITATARLFAADGATQLGDTATASIDAPEIINNKGWAIYITPAQVVVDNLVVSYDAAALGQLSAGNLTIINESATSLTLTMGSATNTSGTVSTLLYGESTSGFTPGISNVLNNGATFTSFPTNYTYDRLTAHTLYYLRRRDTDQSNTVISGQFAGLTRFTDNAVAPPTANMPQIPARDYNILVIGDSISTPAYGVTAAGRIDTLLRDAGASSVNLIHHGVGGVDMSYWIDENMLPTANLVSACDTAPADTLVIENTGVNDSYAEIMRSVTDYLARKQALSNYVRSRGFKYVLLPPSYVNYKGNPERRNIFGTARLAEYNLALPSLNAPEKGVFVGDIRTFTFTEQNPSILKDFVHPDKDSAFPNGADYFARIYAYSIVQAINSKISSVTLSPMGGATALSPGANLYLSTTVAGLGNYSPKVEYLVDGILGGNNEVGKVQNGVYTAGTAQGERTITVRSQQDASKSNSMNVVVQPGNSIRTQIVGTRGTNVFEWEKTTDRSVGAVSQTVRRIVLRGSPSGIRLCFVNWRTGAAGQGAITLQAVRLKVAGRYYPVTFDGSATGTVMLDSMLVSDAILDAGSPLTLTDDRVDAEIICRYTTETGYRCGIRTLMPTMGDRAEEGDASLPDRTESSDTIPLVAVTNQKPLYSATCVIGDVSGRLLSVECIGDSINIWESDDLQGTGYPAIFCQANGIPSIVVGAGGSSFGGYFELRNGKGGTGLGSAMRLLEGWCTGLSDEYSINSIRLGGTAEAEYAAHKANIAALLADNPQMLPPVSSGAAGSSGTGFGVVMCTETTFAPGATDAVENYPARLAERQKYNQKLRTQAKGDIPGVVGIFDVSGDGVQGTYPGLEEVPDSGLVRRDLPGLYHDLHPTSGMVWLAAQGDAQTLWGQPRTAAPLLMYALCYPGGQRIELQYVVFRGSAPLDLEAVGANLNLLGLSVVSNGRTIPVAALYPASPTSVVLVLAQAIDLSKPLSIVQTGTTHGVRDASGNRAQVIANGIRFVKPYDKAALQPQRTLLGQWQTALRQTTWQNGTPGANGNTDPWTVLRGTATATGGALALAGGSVIVYAPPEGFQEVIARVRVLTQCRTGLDHLGIYFCHNPAAAAALGLSKVDGVGTDTDYGPGATQTHARIDFNGYYNWALVPEPTGRVSLTEGQYFWYEAELERPGTFNQVTARWYSAGADGSLPVDPSRLLGTATFVDYEGESYVTPRYAGTVALTGDALIRTVEIARTAPANPFAVTGGTVDQDGSFVVLNTDATALPLVASGVDGWTVDVNGGARDIAHIGIAGGALYLMLAETVRIAGEDVVRVSFNGADGGRVTDHAIPAHLLPPLTNLTLVNNSTQAVSAPAPSVTLTADKSGVVPGGTVALSAHVMPTATIGVGQKVTFAAPQGTFSKVGNLAATWTAPSAPGTYTLTATHLSGKTAMVSVVVAPTPVPAAPIVTTQPVGGLMEEGESLRLSVVASGYPAPTFQWRRGGRRIVGATASTYEASRAGSYDCVVVNASGSAVSSAVLVRSPGVPHSLSLVSEAVSLLAGQSVVVQAYAQMGDGRTGRVPVRFAMTGGVGEVAANPAGVDGIANSATFKAPDDLAAASTATVTATVDGSAYPDADTVSASVTLTIQPGPTGTPGVGFVPATTVGSAVWRAQLLSRDWVSAVAAESLVVLLTGQAGPYRMLDNTGYPVQIALIPLSVGNAPTGDTVWHEASRQPDGTSRITVGPDVDLGQVPLTAGVRYRVWVRIAGSDGDDVLLAGYLLAR